MKISWTAAFVLLAMTVAPTEAQLVIADLRNDYDSGVNNGDAAVFLGTVSGTWTLTASHTPDPTEDGNGLDTMQWSNINNNYAYVGGAGGQPQADIINGGLALDEVHFHPREPSLAPLGSPLFAVARWTAAGTDSVLVEGSARDMNTGGGGGVTFEIYLNGNSVFSSIVFNDTDTFSLPLSVVNGSTIDFVIGPNGTADFDSTALGVTISSVPEPSSMLLLGAVVGGLVYCRGRRRRNLPSL